MTNYNEQCSGDTYITPEHVKQALREMLLLYTRWSPYSFFFIEALKVRKYTVRGFFSNALFQETAMKIIHGLETCGAHFHVSGLHNLRLFDGPCIIIGNHMSTLETVLLPALIQNIKPCTFVVKKKLVTGRAWGPIMKATSPIAVTRKNPRHDLETVLSEGAERLSRGISVVIFPQGTRSDAFDSESFNSLGIKLAARAAVPVVPVAFKTDYWGNSPVFRGFGPVHRNRPVMAEFGKSITVTGRGKDEHAAVLSFIESRLRSWGARVV